MRWVGIVIAITLAAVAAFMVIKFSGSNEPQQVVVQQPAAPIVQAPVTADVETVNVVVAANYIPVGTAVSESMLDAQPWPQHLVIEGFITGNATEIKGMVTRSAFQPREPIIRSKLVNANDPNFLAGALDKGKRVVTVAVNAISGLSGFVFPGDRVDVLLTHPVQRDMDAKELEALRGRDSQELIMETVLKNIKVVAVDQRSSVSNEEGIRIPSSVSVEVTPEQAQKLKLAEDVGKIALSLRSIRDKDTVESIGSLRQSELTEASGMSVGPTGSGAPRGVYAPVTVIRGTEVEDADTKRKKEEEEFQASLQDEYLGALQR